MYRLVTMHSVANR